MGGMSKVTDKELIELLDNCSGDNCDCESCPEYWLDGCKEILMKEASERLFELTKKMNCTIDAPVIESAHVVHAHWMRYEVDVAEHPWHCSHCGWCPPKHVLHIEEMEYCSHCGAKMDEKTGGQNES